MWGAFLGPCIRSLVVWWQKLSLGLSGAFPAVLQHQGCNRTGTQLGAWLSSVVFLQASETDRSDLEKRPCSRLRVPGELILAGGAGWGHPLLAPALRALLFGPAQHLNPLGSLNLPASAGVGGGGGATPVPRQVGLHLSCLHRGAFAVGMRKHTAGRAHRLPERPPRREKGGESQRVSVALLQMSGDPSLLLFSTKYLSEHAAFKAPGFRCKTGPGWT